MNNLVMIIGGGPAGMAAALQLKRQGRESLLFESQSLGSLLRNAQLVENYLGFPDGISGFELMERFKRQVLSWEIRVEYKTVTSLSYGSEEQQFKLKTADSMEYLGDIVVVASGTKPTPLPLVESLSAEDRLRVFYDVVSLIEVEDRHIVVIGAGDVAHDYALNLARLNQVWLVQKGEASRALPILQKRTSRHPRIERFDNTLLREIGPGGSRALSLTFDRDGQRGSLACDYLVCAIGRETQKDFYSPDLFGEEGALVNMGRLHLAGDVQNGSLRQVSIAAGDGIAAAMKIDCFFREGEL